MIHFYSKVKHFYDLHLSEDSEDMYERGESLQNSELPDAQGTVIWVESPHYTGPAGLEMWGTNEFIIYVRGGEFVYKCSHNTNTKLYRSRLKDGQ